MFEFKNAKAIWIDTDQTRKNRFVGFHTHLSMEKETDAIIKISARSYYRLYINGKIIANGPARTAKGYCRVDLLEIRIPRECDIAVEVVAYSKPEKYSNDCTMEPGMLIAEIT